MPSERIQRQIDRLLNRAQEAIALGQWQKLRAICERLLSLAPDNSDATRYLALADKELTTDVISGSSDAIEASPDETSLIDAQSAPALELIDPTMANPENFNWLRKTNPGITKRREAERMRREIDDQRSWNKNPGDHGEDSPCVDAQSEALSWLDKALVVHVADNGDKTAVASDGVYLVKSNGQVFKRQESWPASEEDKEVDEENGASRVDASNIEAPDEYGWTPLHHAAESNSLDVISLLLDHGADMNVNNNNGWTPLHNAAFNNSLGAAILLLDHGADIDAKNNDDLAPLHVAAMNNSVDGARLLIELGADTGLYTNIDAKNNDGLTPLHVATMNKAVDGARLLIELGADIGSTNNVGLTPLHIAALNNSVDMTTALIECNADIEAKDNDGQTPLHFAAIYNAVEVARLLLIDGGADSDAKDHSGMTALHFAAMRNSFNVFHLLIHYGADIDAIDEVGGMTPMHYATHFATEGDAVASLLRRNAVRLLIGGGADIDAEDHSGSTALHYAALNQSHDIVRLLIKRGANTENIDLSWMN